MAQPTFDNIDYGVPGKAIGRAGSVNYTFGFTGQPPVTPADLAASEARIIAAVQAAVAPLKAAIAALPDAAGINASFAALKITVGTIQAALKAPAAGSLGQIALTQTDGSGGFLVPLWVQTNAGDTAPTIIYNGVNLTLGTVKLLTPS